MYSRPAGLGLHACKPVSEELSVAAQMMKNTITCRITLNPKQYVQYNLHQSSDLNYLREVKKQVLR